LGLKDRWRVVRPEILSGLLFTVCRVLGRTLRLEVANYEEPQEPTIFFGWHGRSLLFANHFRNRGYWVIISQSRDGEMQTRIFQRLGFRVIRGSTGRGGVRAAVEAIRHLRKGGVMAMTPDGPRGPSQKIQDGILLMAQKSGAALVPVGLSANPRKIASSWDKYLVPMPFSKGAIVFGEKTYIRADATEDEVNEIRARLEEECNLLQDDAERKVGAQDLHR